MGIDGWRCVTVIGCWMKQVEMEGRKESGNERGWPRAGTGQWFPEASRCHNMNAMAGKSGEAGQSQQEAYQTCFVPAGAVRGGKPGEVASPSRAVKITPRLALGRCNRNHFPGVARSFNSSRTINSFAIHFHVCKGPMVQGRSLRVRNTRVLESCVLTPKPRPPQCHFSMGKEAHGTRWAANLGWLAGRANHWSIPESNPLATSPCSCLPGTTRCSWWNTGREQERVPSRGGSRNNSGFIGPGSHDFSSGSASSSIASGVLPALEHFDVLGRWMRAD
jgi:hypothetical protein